MGEALTAVKRTIGDASKHSREPDTQIHIVELGRYDQR
jgi:hypothetical protein